MDQFQFRSEFHFPVLSCQFSVLQFVALALKLILSAAKDLQNG